VGDVAWPADTALVAILRDGLVLTPSRDDAVEGGDELLFVATQEAEPLLQQVLAPHHV
jgi:trk system potassium uptake protein TrkA